MTVIVGLTGPIGCGKSTVAGWLGEMGAAVIDADAVAHQVTAPGSPAVEAIAAEFGEGLVLADGSLDRASLGRLVFADPEALARLEAIVHPAVRSVILDAIAAARREGAPVVAVEAIKLVQGGLAELCDEVWLVTCDPSVQLQRVLARSTARGLSPVDAEARIVAQGDLTMRLTPFATRVIDTTADAETTRASIAAVFAELPAGSSEPGMT